MALPVPTFASAKLRTGVPPKLTTSGDTTPTSAAVPVVVAVVVLSYTLLAPVNPDMVKFFAVMLAVNPVGWVKE